MLSRALGSYFSCPDCSSIIILSISCIPRLAAMFSRYHALVVCTCKSVIRAILLSCCRATIPFPVANSILHFVINSGDPCV